MDLLFTRYASPFLLLDAVIQSKRFFDFIDELIELDNEKSNWEVYLHKVFDKSYMEFKDSLNENKPTTKVMSPSQIEATINDSLNIINGFIPKQEGGDV